MDREREKRIGKIISTNSQNSLTHTHLARVRGDNRQDFHDLGARQVARLEQLVEQALVKRIPVGQLEVLHHARIDEAGARRRCRTPLRSSWRASASSATHCRRTTGESVASRRRALVVRHWSTWTSWALIHYRLVRAKRRRAWQRATMKRWKSTLSIVGASFRPGDWQT